MEKNQISDDEGSTWTVFEGGNIEYANPIEVIAKISFRTFMHLGQYPFEGKGLPPELVESFLQKKAIEEWDKEYNGYMDIAVPKGLFDILNASSKKDQIKALKHMTLSTDIFISFIFKAYLDHGYTYSFYKSKHYHKGLDTTQLPTIAYQEKSGDITVVGSTSLTDGQLKQTIEQRSMKIARFLDNGDDWHCFFHTSKGLAGKEANEIPHVHYISSKWGLEREYVRAQLQNRTYNLPSVHINHSRDRGEN